MKLKYILPAIIAGVGLLFSSCEDGLDIPKHGNMGTQDDFYKTDSEALEAVSTLYSSWAGNYYNLFMLKNLLSDDSWTGGGMRGDNPDLERVNEYTFATDCTVIRDSYAGLYAMVYNANLIIAKVTPDTPVKSQVVAEAYFFRALAYFDLVTLWGGTPIVDHPLEAGEYHQPNSKPEDIWAMIEEDLRTAIDSKALATKNGPNDETGGIRVSLEAAQAMLGKALLFQGKHREAAIELDKVIDSKKYELYQGDYDMLQHAATNGCCEAILEVQKRKDPEQTWSQFHMTYLMIGWRTGLMNGGRVSDVMPFIANGTYGFLNPTKKLYDAFVAREGKDGYRLRSTIRTYEELNSEYGLTVNSGERLVGHEGLFNWKNRALKDDCITDAEYFQGFQYINPRVMRYAEVLLLAAEAHVMGGGNRADEYVNAIRTRAHLQPLSGVTLEDVKAEKRLELCMECVRFQDIVRWGEGEKYLGEQGKTIPAFTANGLVPEAFTNSSYGFKAKHNLLPIPLLEMEINPNMKQNTGW